MPSPLSLVEEKWLKQHLRGEHYFLRAYRLSIYKIEHHEQGRQILRQPVTVSLGVINHVPITKIKMKLCDRMQSTKPIK